MSIQYKSVESFLQESEGLQYEMLDMSGNTQYGMFSNIQGGMIGNI